MRWAITNETLAETVQRIADAERDRDRYRLALEAIAGAPHTDAIKARIDNHYSHRRILDECRALARETLEANAGVA